MQGELENLQRNSDREFEAYQGKQVLDLEGVCACKMCERNLLSWVDKHITRERERERERVRDGE